MKKEFKKIWEIALPYQDKRNDQGHARIVTEYAVKLCEIENINDKIVVPAAILHDIGWSQVSARDRKAIFSPDKTPEIEYKIRIKHQKEGVKLARKILNKVNYPKNLTKQILEIISEHDTRKGFISKEEAAMRDADKLWRYSKIGFEADIRRFKFTFKFLYNKMRKRIDEENFLFFDSSKKISKEELKNRRKDLENIIARQN